MTFSRRLTLTVVLTSLVTALILGLGALLSTRALFNRYVQQTASSRRQILVDSLASYYQDKGSWEGVGAFLSGLPLMGPSGGAGSSAARSPGQGPMGPGGPGGMGSGGSGGASGRWRNQLTPGRTDMAWGLLDRDRRIVAHSQTGPVDPTTGLPAGLARAVDLPVRSDGAVVGHLLLSSELGGLLGSVETEFRRSLWTWLAASSLVALGLGALVGWLSAATLRRRANGLALAAAAVGSRRFDVRVPDVGGDELGQVAGAFNRMAEELQRSEQARRHLFADVAHELRTPLAILRGQLELLEDGVLEPTPSAIGALHDDAVRLGRLVADLEQLSLAEAGRLSLHWQSFAPADWLAQEVEVFREAAADQGVGLSLEALPTLPPEVDGDPDRLGQVLANLISNALRHTSGGGAIAVAGAAEGDGWRFSVRDSGEGIAPEDLPHVFDRFYRAPKRPAARAELAAPAGQSAEASAVSEALETRRGSGLGLAIVKGLVQIHGGRVWAESALGRGSTFHVWLPLHRPAGA